MRNDRTSHFHSGNGFICQELMPDPFFLLGTNRARVLCFIVLIDALYPHYSQFD